MSEFTSFEPRPNPDITFPSIRRGKGGSGPESDPMIVGRKPSGRIVVFDGSNNYQLYVGRRCYRVDGGVIIRGGIIRNWTRLRLTCLGPAGDPSIPLAPAN